MVWKMCVAQLCIHMQAVAVGSNWAAAATTKQYLRIYSNKAVQLSVLALPGPIVAMAGYKKHLALVYHRTPAVLNCQNLELRLLNIEKEVCEATVHLGTIFNEIHQETGPN